MRIIFIITVMFLISSCSTSQIKSYNKIELPIHNPNAIKFSTKLETGAIKSGHSSWILTKDFSDGKNPTYFCMEQNRHTRGDHTWMFEYSDQKTIINNINKVLISNNAYDLHSSTEVVLFLEKIEQGEGDFSVYTFDIELFIFQKGELDYRNKHHLKGNEMSEEFWTFDSWTGAKKRATNRLVTLIIGDINLWLKKSNK